MEYLFTEYGYSSQETEQYLSLLYVGTEADGNIPELAKHYIVCSAGIDILDLFSLENSLLLNGTDGSAVESHTLTLLTVPGTDFSTGVTLFYGNNSTEFGTSPYTYLFDWKITYHF